MTNFRFEVWPTEYREITQHFGANTQYYKQFNLPGHDGIDIRARQGTNIFAVADGTVTRVHLNPNNHNYGIHVRIEHVDGYITTYAHLSKTSVFVDQRIESGTILGLAGNTGNSFGPHLHLSLKKRGSDYHDWPYDLIDPTPFLLTLMGWEKPVGAKIDGWVLTSTLFKNVDLAQVHVDGARVWTDLDTNHLVAGGTIVELTGTEKDLFTLVKVTKSALGIDVPVEPPLEALPQPTMSVVKGWVAQSALQVMDGVATVPALGLMLYMRPTHDADPIGMLRPNSQITVISSNTAGYLQVASQRTNFEGDVNLPHLPPLPDDTGKWDYDTENPVFLGWVESRYLNYDGVGYAMLNHSFGAALRPKPELSASSIGLVKAYATISIVGHQEGHFVPSLVSYQDLFNPADPMPPIQSPRPLPTATDRGAVIDSGKMLDGWTHSSNIDFVNEDQPRLTRFGGLLREKPQRDAASIGYIKPLTALLTTGTPDGEFTPIRIREDDMAMIVEADPWASSTPTSFDQPQTAVKVEPIPQTNSQPSQPVPAVIKPAAPSTVSSSDQIEQPVWKPQPIVSTARHSAETSTATDATQNAPTSPIQQMPEPVATGQARIGLHASTDPGISQDELNAFAAMRPGVIKLLSSADPDAVGKLAKSHPNADWIVRAFLSFGERNVTPTQFVEWTLSDVQRTIQRIGHSRVYVELHNEPNLYQEGLAYSWADGVQFATWYSAVAAAYRQALPEVKLIYPGLSPGAAVVNVRQDHIQFIEQSRTAVDASDCLGVHIYWSRMSPMREALDVLDAYLTRFRNKPIWITEASNNDKAVPYSDKAKEYLQFWNELQSRPYVRGVTYFAASASNPAFSSEVWVGNGVAEIVGKR